jgi:phage terminase large subunit GpA-like protein
MDTYQKTYRVPRPTVNYIQQLELWILNTYGQDALDRYIAVNNLHEELVAQADKCGDRVIIWHEHGADSFWEMFWKSHEIHMHYMDQIPKSEHEFYTKLRSEFHDYFEAKKGLAAL